MPQLGPLKNISLRGFLSIRDARLWLRPITLLVGPNGAGKSNLIKFFRFMGKLRRRDLRLHVRQLGGADAVLYLGRKVTDALHIELQFDQARYQCTLVPTEQGALVFAAESADSELGSRSQQLSLGKPGDDESGLPRLADRHTPVFLWRIATHIDGWGCWQFSDVSAGARLKQTTLLDHHRPLDHDGGNLASVLYRMQHQEARAYRRIVETIGRVAPAFQDFVLLPEETEQGEQIRLRWKQHGVDDHFDVSQMSDGTLRFICLATVLLQPKPASLIVLDEPELGLHPYAVHLLAAMMRSTSARTQIIAATQSVTLANQFPPEGVMVVDTDGHGSRFRRLNTRDLALWLDEFRIGDLWENNLVGGTPA